MENRTTKTRRARQRKARARKVLLTISLLLVVVAASVGGTLAWLTATTAPVVNTFTYGDINIDLFEHAYDAGTNKLGEEKVKTVTSYKIIPGVNLPKDPTVEVKAGSEACWLFVEVKEEGTFVAGKVTYSIANGWTPLTGVVGVYYREVGASTPTANQEFAVLKDNTITVSKDLTKTEINSVADNPKLTFKAYAVQKDNVSSAADAWTIANTTTTNP